VEKVVYVLWRPPHVGGDGFASELHGPVADALIEGGVRGLEVNVDDAAVAESIMRIVATKPPMSAVLGIWLDAASPAALHAIDDVLNRVADRIAAYLVTESEPLPNTAHPAVAGQRTAGVNNVAFLRRPTNLDYPTWLHRWQHEHTQVAIETQNSFGYVQNVVVRPLSTGAPAWDGIVSELFPAAALTDLQAMFAGDGDRMTLHENVAEMRRSTARFGADTNLDVLPTSQYLIKSPFCS
jgi:hypothetical protein